MKPNTGSTERSIRIGAGIPQLSAFLFVDGNLRWLGLIGVVPILTGTQPAFHPAADA